MRPGSNIGQDQSEHMTDGVPQHYNRRMVITRSWIIMRTATCSCGQLSIKCSGEPTLVAQCHCLACQRRTGSTYGIGAFFPRAGVNVSGAEKTFTRQSDSGYPIVFHFCPECGSNVYWEPRRKPEVVAIAAGAFADPTFPGPTKEVFIEHRHHWLQC